MIAASRQRKGELVEIIFEQLGNSAKGRVLVVESNPCDLTHARIAMVGQGFSDVDAALNLEQAYELTRRNEYQVVLVDYCLPDGDGFELLEWLDNKSEVIMLSSSSVQNRSQRTNAIIPATLSASESMVM